MTSEEYGAAYAKGINLTVGFLRSRNYSPEDAEDIAQSAWTLGWERLGQLRDDSLLMTWMFSIALNVGRSKVRREKDLIVYEPMPDATTQPRYDERLDAEKLLGLCDPEHGRLLALQHLEGLSIVEIVELTGKNENTVKVQLFRGRVAIRERVERTAVRGRAA